MTFKFVPGEYKTRDGRRAVVLSDQYPRQYGEALTGVIAYEERWEGASWFANGRYHNLSRPHDYDLMPPCQELWVNVYPCEITWGPARWPTRQIADREQMEGRIAVLHLTFSADGKELIFCEIENC